MSGRISIRRIGAFPECPGYIHVHSLQDDIVDAFVLELCQIGHGSMELLRHSHDKFPGVRFIRLVPLFLAELKVVIDRIAEGFLDFVHGSSLESDHISRPENFAVESPCIVDVLHFPSISFV